MKKVALLVGIVVVVSVAAILALRYYPQLCSKGTAANTTGEPAKTAADVKAKEVVLSAEAKKELEEINKIADVNERKERLVRFYSQHDVDRAIGMLEEEVRANPDPAYWIASAHLVECYLQKNDLAGAEKYLKNMMQGDQKASYAYRIAGKFYAQKKDFAKAGEALDKGLKLSEDDESRAFTYATMAEMNAQQGEKEKARENLQKAIKLAPKVEHFKQVLSLLDVPAK